MPEEEEWILTPKVVAKSLGVSDNTIAMVATLVFAIAGGPASADDRLPILGGTKYQILSDSQLDQVRGSFFLDGVILKDGIGFTANHSPSNGRNIYREPNGTLWKYDPGKDMVTLVSDPSLTAQGNSGGGPGLTAGGSDGIIGGGGPGVTAGGSSVQYSPLTIGLSLPPTPTPALSPTATSSLTMASPPTVAPSPTISPTIRVLSGG